MLEIYLGTFLAPVLLLSSPIAIATWRKWKWTVVDVMALAAPGAIWLLMISLRGSNGRSLSNLVELPFLAVLMSLFAWLKGPLQRRVGVRLRPYLLVLAAATFTLLTYLLFPVLEE